MKFYYIVPVLFCFIIACEPAEINLPNASLNGIDGTRPLIVMDQMGSGFRDFELFQSAQQSSIAQLLANQMEVAGSENLQNAFMRDDLGFGNRRKLGYTIDCNSDTFLFAIPVEGNPSSLNNDNVAANEPLNIQAVPNLKIADLNNTQADEQNPYYARISSHETPLEGIRELNPTSFAVWLGMDDVYQHAKNGAGTDTELTPIDEFESNLEELLQKLTVIGRKGVIATIPDMLDAPFFNLVEWNALDISQEQADQLNLLYLIDPSIDFEEGPNGFVYQEGVTRNQMNENEKVIVTVDLDAVKCDMYGSLTAFEDEDVLSEEEIEDINAARIAYNNIIRSKAQKFGLALVDIEQIISPIEEGSQFFDGIEVSGEFASGGFYSVDGYNPTARGSAIITNEFIQALNERYGANIPLVSISEFNGVTLPNMIGL